MAAKYARILLLLFTAILLAAWLFKYYVLPPDLDELEVPDGLHPIVAEKRDELTGRAARAGIPILITAGFRSIDEQNQLYNQGRTTPGKVVTNAKGGESFHNFGLAIDFALLDKNGEAIWDMEYDGNRNGRKDWDEVVEIAKEIGFESGADWEGEFKDYPHLQMDFGLTLRELQRGKKPPGIE
ncbi:M15 family metallopeptidase [Peribacillus glennii]|uniref:M15 family metallopeptidase n=1 Tax=Peribacillus glennii TaxID=2303991 RepID=UPI00269979A0